MRIPNRHLEICGCVILSATLHLHFVAGSKATDEARELRGLAWRKTPASLALLNGATVVWQFNHLQDGKDEGCPYFHPLATMEGAVLTDLRPGDHLWHRGLRFAWKKINGLDGYWTWPEGRERWPDKILGHTDVTAVKVTANDDFSARFELEISYHPPGEPPDLTEKRLIEVRAPDRNGNYRIDWHSVFTAGARGTVLDRTPILGEEEGKWFGGYAGLQFRVAHHDRLSAWTLTNSEGVSVTSKADAINVETRKRLEPLHGKPARWMDLTLDMADGKRAGVMIIDHPGNLRHPPPWHVAAMPHEFITPPSSELLSHSRPEKSCPSGSAFWFTPGRWSSPRQSGQGNLTWRDGRAFSGTRRPSEPDCAVYLPSGGAT